MPAKKKKEVIEAEIEDQALVVQEDNGLVPKAYLVRAAEQAKALQEVIKQSKNVVIIQGKQYLTFENWQILGAFFGYTVAVSRTAPITVGEAQGWEAHAIVLNKDGMTVSEADSMCLNDENKWARSPQFHLRSMASTRACSKALRNVCSHIVGLAGYECTPAEEMDGVVTSDPPRSMPKRKSPPQSAPPPEPPMPPAPPPPEDENPMTAEAAADVLGAKIVKETGATAVVAAAEGAKSQYISEAQSVHLRGSAQEVFRHNEQQ